MAKGISRRRFLSQSAGLGLMAGAAVRPSRAAPQRRDRPNLLFIWTDEQRADTMAAYGNAMIRSPNLNRLAAESAVFRRAYVTQPVCTPSRSSVMTGLWPHVSGCTANNIPLRPETKVLPQLLGDADYRTAYMGKWHLGDEIFAQHGFDEWVSIEDGYARYYRPGRDRDARSDYHHFLVEKGYQPDRGDRFSRSFAARRPIEHCKPAFLEQRACDFLRRHRNRPFALYINFLEPHMPFFGPLDHVHDPDEIELPETFDDPLEENEPLRYRAKRLACMERYGKDAPTIRALISRYYGLVTQVDRSVGGILKTLDELGLADDTIVVYTSDHGDMMGAHKLVAKSVMYEEAVRVPWLVRAPRLGRRQRILEQPTSHIDLVPTLLELMGGESRDDLPGRSLVPVLRGQEKTPRDVHIEWNPGQGALRKTRAIPGLASKAELQRVAVESTRTVITPDGWKLCLSDRDRCQLFALRDDPGETRNLYDSGRHGDVIKRLAKKIHRWQERNGDTVRLPV